MKFGTPMLNAMPMTVNRSKTKPEVKFNMADDRFHKPEVEISLPWIEIAHRNLVYR